jgi:hypothetical protein
MNELKETALSLPENAVSWHFPLLLRHQNSRLGQAGIRPGWRNFTISLRRFNGVKCIASGLRKLSWNAERVFELIGVNKPVLLW